MRKILMALMMVITMATAAFATTNAEVQFEGSFKDYATMAALNGLKNGTSAAVYTIDESYFSVAPFSVPEFESISKIQLNAFNFLVNSNYYKSVTVLGNNLVKTVSWDNTVEYIMVM